MQYPMTSVEEVRAAIAVVAGERASARLDDSGRVRIILDASGLDGKERDALERRVHSAATLPGIAEVQVVVTAERIRPRIVAVGSGKGGVGKSTLSANLAVALMRAGRRVGLVDADIYGPSQPRLFGVEGIRPTALGSKLDPVATPSGVPILSIGSLVEPGKALAWRGPMTGGALGQMIDAEWGPVDTLIVDLPPGTGDIQITMIQKHKPAGAVIVSTPQDLALIDARRAIDLFRGADVPIIGLIENMAGYACPHCGEVSDPFGRGGAEAAAAELGIPFLGRVPLEMGIRVSSDAGQPPALAEDDKVFAPLAAQIADWLASSSSGNK